jgi:YesN/AraC family two-component response regulator
MLDIPTFLTCSAVPIYGHYEAVKAITERKMKKAVELFLSKSLKIFEVAQLLGYDNAYYFSKVFKKQYGMSPKSFIAKRKT